MLVKLHVIVKSMEPTYPIMTKYFFEWVWQARNILDFIVIE